MKRAPEAWPNGFYVLDEADIALRDAVVSLLTARLRDAFQALNRAVRFLRVETPCITPAALLKSHMDANFELVKVGDAYLRPESTVGTYEAFKAMFPIPSERKKNLPTCVWQVSRSFRDEVDRPWNELRFKEFDQVEYQLFYAEGTKADYHGCAVEAAEAFLRDVVGLTVCNEPAEPLPHYSAKTTDVYGGLENNPDLARHAAGPGPHRSHELVAISTRKDFECPVVEVSAGLTRIAALWGRSAGGD